jgi:hypothetical protein
MSDQMAILADIKEQRKKLKAAHLALKDIKDKEKRSKHKTENTRSRSQLAIPEPDFRRVVNDIIAPKKLDKKKRLNEAAKRDAKILNPKSQIAPHSHLGILFKQLDSKRKSDSSKDPKKIKKSGKGGPPSDSSSSSTSDSGDDHGSRADMDDSSNTETESSSESSSSPSSDLSSSNSPSPSSSESASSPSSSSSSSESSDEGHRKRRKTKKKKSKSHKYRREHVKPIEPRNYNGAADTTQFSRFVQESMDFIKTGRIHKRRQLFTISRYLVGKAYKYYEQKYSLNPAGHNVREFFTDLFSHCFPPNFKSDLREKLYATSQGNRKVRDFVYELIQMFTLLGEDNERTRVIHLWDGLRPHLREGLLTNRYHKETSSWDEVVEMAEILEIAAAETEKIRSTRYRESRFGDSN